MPMVEMFEIDAKGNIFANLNIRRNKEEQEEDEQDDKREEANKDETNEE